MKKEARLVLIVGILGLFVSVIYLVFMNGNNIDDDKNIPIIDENNQEQTGKNILTGILQEGSTGIQDLTGKNILTGNNNGKAQSGQIKNNFGSGSIFSGENVTGNSQKTGKISKNELVVMLPEWFYNYGFEQLAKQIYQQTGIIVIYKKINSLADYKEYLKNLTGKTVDIYMLPSDRLKNFSGKKINLGENIKPYFHVIFSNIIDGQVGFVPYSIDPLITFVNKNSIYNQDIMDINSLFSYTISWKKTKNMAIPLLFGVDENDVKLLEKNQESYPNYFIFWYNLLYQFKKGKNFTGLNTFFDTINFNSDYKRNLIEFKKLVINIAKKNPKCKIYPSVCLFSYRFADISFGFLSDQNIIDSFTGGGIDLENVLIYNFPIVSEDYKVRAWGFVVDSMSEQNSQIDYFLKTYIKTSILNSLPLWENNLSAFNNIFQIQKIQKRYENILKYEPKFSLLYSDINLQENFIKKTNLTKLLLGEYNSDLFLNNLSRER